MMRPTRNTTPERATKVRWAIMACVTMVTMLTYLDRLNFGIAGKYIQDEYGLSTQMMGWMFSAFLVGYAAFQVPGGWAGDRYGPKNVLTIAILMWSLFTALTGLVPDLLRGSVVVVVAALIVSRVLVGLGEAANSPNGNKIVSNWMGTEHRGIGSSFTILGIGIGGAITPPLIASVVEHFGWRTSFYLSGLLGLFVVLVWEWYVTNSPEEHVRVNREELRSIQAGRIAKRRKQGQSARPPWKHILTNKSVWGLSLGYMCQGYPIYFFHTWLFIYLVRVRHLSGSEGGLWTATPYIAITILSPLGGWFSDRAVRRFGKLKGRRLAACLGVFTSALLLWVGGNMVNSSVAVLLLAGAAGFNMFAATTFWATCIDLTEEFTGSLSGLMNTFGNVGGWLSPIVTAYLAIHYGWNRALDCAAFVSLASGIFFFAVRADRSLDATARTPPDSLLRPTPKAAISSRAGCRCGWFLL